MNRRSFFKILEKGPSLEVAGVERITPFLIPYYIRK
jgi:hypothetical protein